MNRLLVAIAGSLTLALPVLAQSPCFITDVGTDLQLANDDTAQGLNLGFPFPYAGVSYTSICVCSNGYIWFGPSSPAGGETNPTVGDLITGAPRLCALWNDFDPSNFRSGHVFYRTIPASGTTPARAVISWANVVEWFGANRVSMQVVLDSTGEFSITYGANPAAGNYLVPDMIVGMSSGVAGATYPMSLANRPLFVPNDFSEVWTRSFVNPGWPYSATSLRFIPMSPGYLVQDGVCAMNELPHPALSAPVPLIDGCPRSEAFYEAYDDVTNPVDLSNRRFVFTPNGSRGYLLLQMPGSSGWFAGYTNNLQAADDSRHVVNLPFAFPYLDKMLTSVAVSSNGFVHLDTNQIDGCGQWGLAQCIYWPNLAVPRIAPLWTDLIPSTAGDVYADFDTNTGDYVITWDQMGVTGGGSCTFQLALKSNGEFEFRYQSLVMPGTGYSAVAGFSPENMASDPGPRDLSSLTAFNTGPGGPAVELNSGGAVPTLGSTLPIAVSGFAPVSNIVVLFLSSTVGGYDLTPFGAPGCYGYIDLSNTVGLLTGIGGASSVSYSIPIPNSLALDGMMITGQAVVDDVGANALGLRISNACFFELGI